MVTSISQPIEPTRATFKQRMQRATSQYLHAYTLCTVFASIGGFIFGFDTGEYQRLEDASIAVSHSFVQDQLAQ